jgi:hypothetical protein
MAGSVFVSYSRSDRAYVERLAAHLEAAGLTVWWDNQMEAGVPFGSRIQRAIDECDVVIPVLTPAAAESRWVGREIAYADERGKPMLPLVLIPCTAPLVLAGLHLESVVGGQLPGVRFIDRLRVPSMDDTAPVPGQPRHGVASLTRPRLGLAAVLTVVTIIATVTVLLIHHPAAVTSPPGAGAVTATTGAAAADCPATNSPRTALTVWATASTAYSPAGADLATSVRPVPNTALAATTTTGSGTGWVELAAQGGTSAFGVSQPAPDGRGFVLDSTVLAGQQIVAGPWILAQQVKTTGGTVTGDVTIRVYRLESDGTFIPIVTATATGLTIGPSNTLASPPTVTGRAVCFGTADRLYFDVFVDVVSGAITSAGGLRINRDSIASGLTTPGYARQRG